MKEHFVTIAKKTTGGRFIVDERNKQVVSCLFNYFMGKPSSLNGDVIDHRKGLWIEGSLGTGKSTLMQVFSAFMISIKQGFKVFACSSVASCYSIDGNLDFFLENKDGYIGEPVDICFDELGREPIPSSYYGTKLNVMQHILQIRYEIWKTSGIRTFITTNSDAKDIIELYGEYIRDRRKEMFNIVPIEGASRR